MEIYVGGFGQNKLSYVLEKKRCGMERVVDGGGIFSEKDFFDQIVSKLKDGDKWRPVIVNNFHLLVKNFSNRQDLLDEYADALIKNGANLIIICNQVGGGIVPMDESERVWREQVGRIMCGLVKGASRVERIICGLGQAIK